MRINDDGLTPNYGELVICDWCGIKYKFFIWAFGSDKHLCRKCVNNRPQAHLDDDAIDIEKEHDIISKESHAQHRKDFPLDNRQKPPRKKFQLSRATVRKIELRQNREAINRFKKIERSAKDVTELG